MLPFATGSASSLKQKKSVSLHQDLESKTSGEIIAMGCNGDGSQDNGEVSQKEMLSS